MPTVLSNGALRNGSLMLTSPAALFAAGEVGVWYDPSDMYTLFQDAAGTTPVTAVEQPVGLMLDKSGNGKHASQSTAASRPVLSARVNLLLATDTLSTQSVTTVATTYTLSFSGAGSITLSGTKTGTYSAGTSSLAGVTAGTLTLTVSGTVTNADLRVANDGVNIPTYQRVNTSTDYDTVGFPAYLRFDGVDDWMITGSVNFSSTNKVTFCAGIRKLSEAAAAQLLDFTSYPLWPNGAFAVEACTGTNANNYQVLSSGTNAVGFASTANYRAPITSLLTATADIPGDSIVIRVNGVVDAVNSSDQGSGNYGNYPINIGSRNSGALRWFNGRLYGLVVRGASSTATEIANTERWLNGKTRAM